MCLQYYRCRCIFTFFIILKWNKIGIISCFSINRYNRCIVRLLNEKGVIALIKVISFRSICFSNYKTSGRQTSEYQFPFRTRGSFSDHSWAICREDCEFNTCKRSFRSSINLENINPATLSHSSIAILVTDLIWTIGVFAFFITTIKFYMIGYYSWLTCHIGQIAETISFSVFWNVECQYSCFIIVRNILSNNRCNYISFCIAAICIQLQFRNLYVSIQKQISIRICTQIKPHW